MPDEPDAVIDVFARALQAVEQSKQSEVALSNGIVLGLRTVSAGLLRRVVTGIAMPPIPVIYLADKGRDEENPLDPAYLAAVQKCHADRLEADMRARRTLGTYPKVIPEGMYGPDDDGWVDAVRVAGIEPNLSNSAIRYSEWLDCYAISAPIDHVVLSSACFAASGIFDEEVAVAIDYFGVERNGEPIQTYPLRRRLATGIQYRVTLPGLVPAIEEREAAIFCGYTWQEWNELPRDDRVDGIAHFRVHQLIAQHVEDAVRKDAERKRPVPD